MCPYYDERRNVCTIYQTLQTAYSADTYCKENGKSCYECPNYKACKDSYNGVMPSPSKFR